MLVFIATLIGVAIAMAAMGVGLILRGRPLRKAHCDEVEPPNPDSGARCGSCRCGHQNDEAPANTPSCER